MNSPSASPATDSLPASLAIVHSAIQRLAGQSASCKIWSVAVVAVALLFAAGRTGGAMLLWVAAPAALLGLVDAACVAEARRMASLGADSCTKDRSDVAKIADLLRAQAAGPGYPGVLKGLAGVLSPSVWPFYLGLTGMMVAMAHSGVVSSAATVAPLAPQTLPNAPTNPQLYSNAPQFRPNSQMPNIPNMGRPTNPNGMPQSFAGQPQGQRPSLIPPPTSRPPGAGNSSGSPATVRPQSTNPLPTFRPVRIPAENSSASRPNPGATASGILPAPSGATPAPATGAAPNASTTPAPVSAPPSPNDPPKTK